MGEVWYTSGSVPHNDRDDVSELLKRLREVWKDLAIKYKENTTREGTNGRR